MTNLDVSTNSCNSLCLSSYKIESVTSEKVGPLDFCQIANNLLHKGRTAIPPLFQGREVLSSGSDKTKLFPKIFSKNSNLEDSGISLPAFPTRTNLKQHNISVTAKLVKKFTTNLDLSKTSGPDYIPEVVLKNCEPELSYILAEPFTTCLKESCFLDCWKVLSVAHVFKNAGENHPANLLSVVCEVFEKLVNNRLANHLEKYGFLKNFQFGFRSSQLTAGLLTVAPDRIVGS